MLTLKELELLHIRDCLIKNGYHRDRTAKELGIGVRTLKNKIAIIKNSGVDVPTRRTREEVEVIQGNHKYFVYGLPTNEERLHHADSMLNRDYL